MSKDNAVRPERFQARSSLSTNMTRNRVRAISSIKSVQLLGAKGHIIERIQPQPNEDPAGRMRCSRTQESLFSDSRSQRYSYGWREAYYFASGCSLRWREESGLRCGGLS